VADGQQLLPLIDHLARVGRRAADTCGTSCLRPRHLIALKLLGEHDSLTQHALGAALSLDPSNVVGLLNELEERDLITRRRDPADRRRHIVELSDSGSAELARAYREFGVVEDDLFKMLTTEERATLYTLLSRAVAALAPSCETAECTAGQAELSFPLGAVSQLPGRGAPAHFLTIPKGLVTADDGRCGTTGSYAASWISGVARDPGQYVRAAARRSPLLAVIPRDSLAFYHCASFGPPFRPERRAIFAAHGFLAVIPSSDRGVDRYLGADSSLVLLLRVGEG